MISTRSAGLLIDTVVCLTLANWETVSGRFGGYLTRDLAPMTSANSLVLILRRLDEIERKLDRILEIQTPTAIGYSVRRGNLPRKD
jgi:hypothetical protein